MQTPLLAFSLEKPFLIALYKQVEHQMERYKRAGRYVQVIQHDAVLEVQTVVGKRCEFVVVQVGDGDHGGPDDVDGLEYVAKPIDAAG